MTEELAVFKITCRPSPMTKRSRSSRARRGGPSRQCFASFDRNPLAAASIAQAHRATLPDGAEVVVKVRRPGIEATIETDIEILLGIAHLVEERLHPGLVDPVRLIREFARASAGSSILRSK